MQIKELNNGEKADYSLNGNFLVLSVFDKSIGLDLEVMQEDEKKTFDICLDKKGNIVEGIDKWYIANVTIPAAEYELQDTGETDEQGEPVYEKVKNPLNTDNVKLDLWALPTFILDKQKTDEGEDI